jgi:hypothetical protein
VCVVLVSKLCLSYQQSFVDRDDILKEFNMNHKSTPTQLVYKSHQVSAAIHNALALSLRSQKITNKTLRSALLNTKKTSYSELGNFFAETIMFGEEQFLCFGKVVAGDEFLDSFTVLKLKGLTATITAEKIALTRLEVLEEIFSEESKAVSYAA